MIDISLFGIALLMQDIPGSICMRWPSSCMIAWAFALRLSYKESLSSSCMITHSEGFHTQGELRMKVCFIFQHKTSTIQINHKHLSIFTAVRVFIYSTSLSYRQGGRTMYVIIHKEGLSINLFFSLTEILWKLTISDTCKLYTCSSQKVPLNTLSLTLYRCSELG